MSQQLCKCGFAIPLASFRLFDEQAYFGTHIDGVIVEQLDHSDDLLASHDGILLTTFLPQCVLLYVKCYIHDFFVTCDL